MKRRELIKKSILGLSATAVALSGCNKKSEKVACKNNEDELNIIPKQTAQYEFSCPLPFNFKTIDEIVELNKGLKKSKVTTFYNNAPNQDFNNWISISRAKNDKFKTYDQFGEFVKYAIKKGFNVTYLMNSPKPFSPKDSQTFEKEFNFLLDYIYQIGIKDIKIANPQVAELITEKYGDKINLHASTALEYSKISQYEYLFNNYPNFTLIDLPNDENQNFKFLKELKNKFPKTKIELMVNEACIKFCPSRHNCISESDFLDIACNKLRDDLGWLHYHLKTGMIYPWNLEYYSALGINNFKFISSAGKENARSNYHDITALKSYLECIENGIEFKSSNFFFEMFDKIGMASHYNDPETNNISLTELKSLLPDIRYFIKHGSQCQYKCNNGCNYCDECAKKIEQRIVYQTES